MLGTALGADRVLIARSSAGLIAVDGERIAEEDAVHEEDHERGHDADRAEPDGQPGLPVGAVVVERVPAADDGGDRRQDPRNGEQAGDAEADGP